MQSKLTIIPHKEDMLQELQEDITCSICLEPFVNPVSIDCGHNFCRDCLSTHWSKFSGRGYHCPECCRPCNREMMAPDTRMRSLVEKIGQIPLQEIHMEMSTAPRQTGQPVQLVGLEEDAGLFLDEVTLSLCLEQGQVKDAPICFISIVGQQRCGKSFLLNFFLRKLQNLEAGDSSWMGQEDEPLTGFQWKPGTDSTTKGVWIWSQPFWIPIQTGKVAVFLIDTEGLMNLETKKEVSVKLSAFSMLLSSFQILNVERMWKDTDSEYLEMCVQVADAVGRACSLESLQHLDVLVRDWSYPAVFGKQAGQTYLQDVIQKMERDSSRHPKALRTLKNESSRCYTMPHPGKRLQSGITGTLAEMDEDFRGYLKDYINILVRSAGHHLKMDQNGITLTGAQFADKIKHFTARVKQLKLGFASVPQMAYTINNLGIKEELEKKFSEFIKDQKKLSGFPKTLTIKPSTMEERLQEKTKELLQEYEDSKQGDESSSKDCKSLLKCHLNDETKDFLKKYKVKYYATAGVLIGTGSVVLASGAIGAGVVGALVAAEAVALGTGAAIAGGATGGLAIAGGTVGHVIGRLKGERSAQQAQNMTDHDTFEEEEEEDLSEEACLIGRSAKLRID